MKYDVLEPLKEHLMREEMSENTAKKYYGAVVKLFSSLQFDSIQEVRRETIESELTKVRTKNEFSAVKNGLKHLKKVYPDMELPSEDFFQKNSKGKRNRSKKPPKTIYLEEVKRKVNQMDNKRLKYAYRLALVSGLRVSELADLEAADIEFQDGDIYVTVRKGKGGHGGTICCRKDPYLYERLPALCEEHREGKLFYSEAYMREKADRLNLECHDFRRIYAILCRNEYRQTMPIEEANAKVMQDLRHVRFSTTKRYLFNRKLKIRASKEQEDGK